jgi:catechol 2,3-dioxygenase-like lactoylglutathione lyase family enzyme
MATLGLNHINIRADRALLDALRDFYCEIVGLHEGFRPPFPGFGYWLYAEGATEAAVVHLYEAELGEARQRESPTYFDHFAFDCTELEAVEAALTKAGVDYHKAIIPLTGQRQVFLVDPAGNRVELNFGTP